MKLPFLSVAIWASANGESLVPARGGDKWAEEVR
jgi:hypothetical protein